MFEDNDKKKKRRSLIVLLCVCIAALGLIYFLPPDEPDIPETHLEEAAQAQETIETLKDKFNELDPDALNSTNYTKALEAEGEGNSAFASGDYIKALPFYNSAIDLYQEAVKEGEPNASENIPPKTVTTVSDSEPEPDPTHTNINNNTDKTDSPPISDNKVYELKQTLVSLKNTMIQAKGAASAVDAENLASSTWQKARKKEIEGDSRYNTGSENISSIESNLEDYKEAKKYYEQATIEARPKKEDRDRKITEEKIKAVNAQTAMKKMEESIPYSLLIRQANGVYKEANTNRSKGENLLEAGDYQLAKDFFQKAKDLYAKAAKEIKAEEEAKNIVIDTSKPSKPDDDELLKAAEHKIQLMVNQLERALESEDLNKMVSFKENKKSWAVFFKEVKNISVKISNVKKSVYLAQNTAHCTFDIDMSYFKTSNRRDEKSSFSKDWQLTFVNGKWVVVSSKIKN